MCNISGAFHYMYIFFALSRSLYLSLPAFLRDCVEFFFVLFFAPTFFHSLPSSLSRSRVELWAKCFRLRAIIPYRIAKNTHTHLNRNRYTQTKRMQISVKMQTMSEHLFLSTDNYNIQHQYLHDLHLKITNSASISIQNAQFKGIGLVFFYGVCVRARTAHKFHCLFYGQCFVGYVLFCISKMI